MTTDPEQQVMDAFWQDFQEHARQQEAKETAINALLETCREIVLAEDNKQLPTCLPSLVYSLRRALSELDEVL